MHDHRQNDLIVPIPSEIGADTPEAFETTLQHLFSRKPEAIALDCADLDHLTSSHVNLLWRARTLAADAGVAVRLVAASHFVRRVLQVLDLDEFFVYDEIPESPTLAGEPAEVLGGLDIYEDTFPACTESIDRALERFLERLRGLGLPRSTQYVLRTIFYEVATNVRLHASTERVEDISFSAILDRFKIVLTFVDGGPPFDPTRFEHVDQSLADSTEGRRSFGITIMRKLSDRMMYRRLENNKNVTVIERKWRSQPWTKARSRSVS